MECRAEVRQKTRGIKITIFHWHYTSYSLYRMKLLTTTVRSMEMVEGRPCSISLSIRIDPLFELTMHRLNYTDPLQQHTTLLQNRPWWNLCSVVISGQFYSAAVYRWLQYRGPYICTLGPKKGSLYCDVATVYLKIVM